MIFIEILYALIAVFCVLTVYAFLDTNNRLYGNLIAEFFAVILAFFIAANAIMGNVVSHDLVQTTTISNKSPDGTFVNSTIAYTDATYTVQDVSLMGIFAFAGAILGIHWLLAIVEAVRESYGGERDV